MLTIRAARRIFFGTAIEDLRITGWLRGRVFKYGYGSHELETTILGLKFALPAGDVSLVPALVGGYYEQLELMVYQRLAEASSVIADVGANIGLYSCVGAASTGDASRTFAFEPAPDNLEFLARNVAQNGLEGRVVIIGEAVSDAPGQARFHLSDGIGNHSLAANNAGSGRHVDVPVTTIDRYFAGERVDILKVDVEGFDVHVLRGARETLRAHKPAVFVELLTVRLEESGDTPSDLIDELTSVYEHVFVIDELRGAVKAVSRQELLALAEGRVHTNLVAVARPEHLDAVNRCTLTPAVGRSERQGSR